jgi:asparagine synthase (glutamine-hydrolysing)
MCGFAGIVSLRETGTSPSVELLTDMIGEIRHRGPDEYGLFRDHVAGLVHARLSLIDLVSGQQPLANEDHSLWIVFNGEIFNYVELRKELEDRGHAFRTRSDTEVIVHAYEEWGDACFARFNGQWSLALWDSRRRTLTFSRDRIGICPLFYREADGKVWFASEVKAIFADPSVPRAMHPAGLGQTFTYWASIAPVAVFEGIRELPPGSVRTYKPGKEPQTRVYWYPTYPTKSGDGYPLDVRGATEALRERLFEASKLRMLRADVPVGSYLSGGIDSSVTAWLGRQVKQGDFRTFSIRFADAEFDETPAQRAMAATLDSRHEEMMVTREDIARVFPDVVWHAERPLLRTAPAPLFLLSKLVRQAGIKAVLTGEGADEVLAGYDIFRETKIREFWSHVPASEARPKLFERLYPYLARSPQRARGLAVSFWRQGLERVHEPGFSHDPRWRTTGMLKRFYAAPFVARLAEVPVPDVLDALPPEFSSWDALGRAQYLEVVTLLSAYLISSQGDRMLMAHSVEGRFPFLDAEVMDFCNALPPLYKIAGLKEKFLLRRLAQGILPPEIVNRQKQPYRAPDAISFVVAGSGEYVGDLLSEQSVAAAGIFQPQAVRTLYAKCVELGKTQGPNDNFSNTDNMALVGILSTQLLHAQFIEGRRLHYTEPIHYRTFVDRTVQGTYHTSQMYHETGRA